MGLSGRRARCCRAGRTHQPAPGTNRAAALLLPVQWRQRGTRDAAATHAGWRPGEARDPDDLVGPRTSRVMNWQRSFVRARTGKVSSSLRELYEECSDEERRLSPVFFERYPLGRGVGTLTAFDGILQDSGPLAFAKNIAAAANGDPAEELD